MDEPVSFGFNLPTFAGAPENGNRPVHRDTPNYERLDWETTRNAAVEANRLGFDSLWIPDHMMLGRNHEEYECWTLLSSLASIVPDLRLGTLVLCNDFRNPALVAKMAATLDVVSDGRLELGVGAGWHEAEYDSYGWEWRGGFERLMRLDESIRLMKEMWTSDEPQFEGDHYQIQGAYCEPRPVQDPHPPILVGGAGEQVTLKLVAKHADMWNTGISNGHVDVLEQKIDVIADHCETVGRDVGEIQMTWSGHVLCTRDEQRYHELLDRILPIRFEGDHPNQPDVETEADAREYMIIGTPEECAAAIERRIDAGITKFQFWFLDYPSLDGLRLFADEVLTEFE